MAGGYSPNYNRGEGQFSFRISEGINVHGVDVIHSLAVITLALLFARGIQVLTEHYFPDSGAVMAERFLWGGPS